MNCKCGHDAGKHDSGGCCREAFCLCSELVPVRRERIETETEIAKPVYSDWNNRFIYEAKLIAEWSKDPRTKVGCVIADKEHNQLSSGFNGFPRGIADDGRLLERDVKLRIIVHAEANAIAAAARNGHSLKGSVAFITLPPCSQCASLLIQAGISQVCFLKGQSEHWEDNWKLAKSLLSEAGVMWMEIQ